MRASVRTGRICAAVLAAGCAALPAATPAGAQDPVLHDVTYTVYTDQPFFAEIYYRDADPPNFGDYSHDPYLFSPNVEAQIGPDNPWVMTVRLANPRHWAMVLGTSGLSFNPPTFHCSLAVDGEVVATNSGAKGALCSLRLW